MPADGVSLAGLNAHLQISPYGLKLIASFEGAPRLKARRCEGGRWELSYGCTTWPDGRDVIASDTCTADQALLLFDYHLDRFEAVVRKHVTVELKQHQFDALVSLAYNIGEEQFRTSTVLEEVNKRNWRNAANAFEMWKFATKEANERDDDEPEAWYRSPAGEPCAYRRALRGLLRRHLAEACVLLGLDFAEGCNDDAVRIRTEREWNPKKGLNEDLVIQSYTTTFAEVWEVARHHPLAPPEAPKATPPAPAPAQPPAAVVVAPQPKPQAPPPAPAAKTADTVDVKNLDIGKIRVENGAKVMETSDRAVAVGLKLGGIGIKTFVERRVLPTWVGGLYFDAVTDPIIVAAITAGVVMLWAWGQGMLVAGRRKRAKHALTATTLVY